MLVKLISLLLVNLAMSQYLSQYEYTRSWNNKKRVMVVHGSNMVEEVKGAVQADGMNCQLSTRNINIIYLSGDQPKDVAFYLDRGTEVTNLSREDVEDVKSDVRRGSGEWALLVGYDGGVKMAMEEKVEWEKVFNKIDRMPMRRREIRSGAVCP